MSAQTIQNGLMAYLEHERGWPVRDMSDDMEAQERGIDFMVRGETAELKACERIAETGNLAFEIIGNFRAAKVGSALRSEAKWLFYYDVINHRCHVMLLRQLVAALDSSPQAVWSVAKAHTLGRNGYYSAWSLLVPTGFLERTRGISYSVLDLKEWVVAGGSGE